MPNIDELVRLAFEMELELRITKGDLDAGIRSIVLKRARSWRHRKKQIAQNLQRVRDVAEELRQEWAA